MDEQQLIRQNTALWDPPTVVIEAHVSYWRKQELKLPPAKLA